MNGNLKSPIGILEVSNLIRWVRSVTTGHYTVRFEQGAVTAWVDYLKKEIVIPQPNSKMSLRDAIRLRGFCIHETSHPRYQPKLGEVVTKYPVKVGSPLAGIYNMVLDVHAESMRAEEFPGDAKALSEFGAVTGHDCYERLTAALKANGNVWPPDFEKMAGLMIACRNAEGLWNIGMVVGFDKLVNTVYTQEMRDIADDLERKFDLTNRIARNPSGEDEWSLWQLSCDIYEYLYEKPADNQIDPPGKGGGKGKKGKEESEGEGKESESGAASPEQGDGDGESVEGKAEEKIKVTELLFSNHYESKGQGKGHGMGFDYTNYKEYSTYTPIDPNQFEIINYGKR